MTGPRMSRARQRALLGASTGLWAGRGGARVEDGRWVALSGAPAADFNVIFCHGADTVMRSREDIMATGAPALIMVAGEALGQVQHLIGEGWVCVGSVPFMVRDLVPPQASQPGRPCRRLADAELPAARALVDEVFGLGPDLAEVAFSDAAMAEPGREAWGAYDDDTLVACVAAVRSEEAVCIWSMATAPGLRRRGYAARLLEAALAAAAEDGAACSLLHASAVGEPFYLARGYAELERWQLWSRPRWVLGRV